MLPLLYETAVRAATPLLESHLKKRTARGKEDPARSCERRGKPALARGKGPLVWFHAASVGESVALLSTIGRLLGDYPGTRALVTTGTITSARTMAERLPEGAFHQYMPVDQPDWVKSFLDHWKPDLVVWTESDFWPLMLLEIRRRKIPAVLLNGCISKESYRNWLWARPLLKEALQAFDLCLAQNADHASRFEKLNVRNVKVSANLKYSSAPLPFDAEKLAAMKAAVGRRPLILWASAHPGEYEMAARIHAEMKNKHPGLLTIIAPRHAQKGPEVSAACAALGLKVSVRSAGALPSDRDDVYLADTMGELGLFYRLATLAIVGGSFCFRSHNPIEPAQLGCVIFYGPVVQHILSLCVDFESQGAALRLPDEKALQEKIAAFLDNPESFAPMARAAQVWTDAKSNVVDDVAAELAPFMQKIAGKAAA